MIRNDADWFTKLTSPGESEYRIDAVEGRIPAYLRGDYYLIGPACFEVGDLEYDHWLDGDGMASKLEFRDHGVFFRNRFVQTRKRIAESSRHRPLYRTFGTRFPDDRLRFGIGLESPANVNIIPWRGKLLACGEQGRPWELDPIDLATLGEFSFGDTLGPIAPFSAHPSVDAENGELINFGVSFSAKSPRLNLYRYDARGQLVYRRMHPLDAPRSIHDFLLTPDFVIVHMSGYVLDIDSLLTGGSTVFDALNWRPELGSFLLVFERQTGALLARLDVGQRYCLHLTNAFRVDDCLTVESLEYSEPIYPHYRPLGRFYQQVEPGMPVRRTIDTTDWRLIDECSLDYHLAPDFPHVDPREAGRPSHRSWMLGISQTGQPGAKFFDQLVRLDWERHAVETSPVADHVILAGEPVFVANPTRSGDGSIICQQIDTSTNRGSFVVFDANDIGRGPCSTLHLREPIPPGFHASFSTQTIETESTN